MQLFKSNVLENGEQQRKTNQNIPSWKLNISDNYWFSISDILMEYLSISQCCFTPSAHQCWQKQILEAGDCLCDEAEGDGDSLSSPRSCSDNARWGVMKISKLEQCYPPCLINNDGAFLHISKCPDIGSRWGKLIILRHLDDVTEEQFSPRLRLKQRGEPGLGPPEEGGAQVSVHVYTVQ